MKKKDVLKAFYLSAIAELIESCSDISLLDLIYRLLIKEVKAYEK